MLTVALLAAAVLALVPRAQAQGSPEMDRQLLSGLYLVLGGSSWDRSDNWLSDAPLDQWYGVSTDFDGRVTGLALSGNGLTGTIPPGLTVLFDPSAFDIRLKRLDLSDNNLGGQMPEGFVGLFPHLEVLNLSNNQFRGAIPSDVSGLSRLVWLDLDNNHFSGPIPSALGDPPRLGVLRLGGNDFNGAIPAELGQLSSLGILGLGNNNLEGQIPEELGNLANLTRMSLFGNQLEGPIPPELGSLSNLTKLSLGNNSLSGDIPAKLGNLDKLEELHFDGNPALTGCVPKSLGGHLTSYNFGGLEFCAETGAQYDTDGDGLIEISNLEQFDAIRYDLDGDGVVDLNPYDPNPYQDVAGATYARAYPNAASGMGCPDSGCVGYELTTDLDFDTNGNRQADVGDAYWNDGFGWLPIGESHENRYNATFDGNRHTLSNLYVRRAGSDYIGLFGATGDNAVVKGVGVDSVNVIGNAGVGGLVGDNIGGTIIASYAAGIVTGLGWNIGGLVGYNGDSTGDGVGGSTRVITGVSSIIASYAWVNVTGQNSAGGLVGHNAGGGIVAASYASGAVSGYNRIGGLVGYTDAGNGAVADSYWDTQSSGQSSSSGGEGKTTAELQVRTGYTGIYANWNVDLDNADGDDDPATGGDDPWDFGTSRDYPTLKLTPASLPETTPTPAPTPTPIPAGHAGDRAALETIYNTTGGKDWRFQRNWMSDVDICEWQGVGCEDGRVTRLQLNRRNLTERIPSALGDLTDLKELRLNGNSLTGKLPSSLEQLSNLELLNLSDNLLSGEIPAFFAVLPNLETLWLHSNEFTGCTPRALEGLVATGRGILPEFCALPEHQGDRAALEALYDATGGGSWKRTARENWLSDKPMSEWAGVTVAEGRVTGLHLSNSGLRSSRLPPELGHLEALQVLDLSNNFLGGEIPEEWGNLSELYSVKLGGNQQSLCLARGFMNSSSSFLALLRLPGVDPMDFCGPDRDVLEILYNSAGGRGWKESTNWLTNKPLDEWDGVATDDRGRVVGITLANNNLKGTIPAALGQLENLEVLELDENELYGSIPPELGSMSSLKVLDLSRNNLGLDSAGTSLEYGIPPELGQLESLEILNLRNNYLLTVIPEELGDLPNLKYLDVFGNNLVGCIPRDLEYVFSLSVSTGLRSTNEGLNFGWVHRIGQVAMQIENAIVDFNSWTKFAFKFLPRPVKGIVVSPNKLGLALGSRLADWLNNRGEFTSDDFDVNMPLCAPSPPSPTTEWQNQTLETDRQALLDLWFHLGGTRKNDDGEAWWTLHNWGDDNIASWEGVKVGTVDTVDGPANRVVELDLTDTVLWGKLDSVAGALGSLGGLRKLDLSNKAEVDAPFLHFWSRKRVAESRLTGNIPKSIGNLFLLQELNISGHGTGRDEGLTGAIPEEVGNLAFLNKLDLSDNTFEGSLPRELGNLHFLDDLNVDNSGLHGCLPEIMRGRFETEVWVQTLVVGMQVIPGVRIHKIPLIKNLLSRQGTKIANNTVDALAKRIDLSPGAVNRLRFQFQKRMEQALGGYKYDDVSIVKGAPAAIGTEGKLIRIVSEAKPRAVLGKEVQLYCR